MKAVVLHRADSDGVVMFNPALMVSWGKGVGTQSWIHTVDDGSEDATSWPVEESPDTVTTLWEEAING